MERVDRGREQKSLHSAENNQSVSFIGCYEFSNSLVMDHPDLLSHFLARHGCVFKIHKDEVETHLGHDFHRFEGPQDAQCTEEGFTWRDRLQTHMRMQCNKVDVVTALFKKKWPRRQVVKKLK